jgi:tetratricopeptide (TPR) repeat protein
MSNSNSKEQVAGSKVSISLSCFAICYLLLAICSCSSSSRNSGGIFEMRNAAELQLELGNRQADRGGFDTALVFISEAMRLAVITDDPGLLARSGISLGNVQFSLGNTEAAFAIWNRALEEAALAGNKELAAVCRVHIARGKLLSPGGKDAAQALRNEVSRDLAQIKSDKQYAAFAWTVIGLAEKELGRYAAAEEAVKRALAIHEKARNLELAAYDWFMIASFRSLSGNSGGALKALESAIEFDRRTENSWGLANDWQAVGDVQKRVGKHDAARAAYGRAAEIFRAIGNSEAAEKALAREW